MAPGKVLFQASLPAFGGPLAVLCFLACRSTLLICLYPHVVFALRACVQTFLFSQNANHIGLRGLQYDLISPELTASATTFFPNKVALRGIVGG